MAKKTAKPVKKSAKPAKKASKPAAKKKAAAKPAKAAKAKKPLAKKPVKKAPAKPIAKKPAAKKPAAKKAVAVKPLKKGATPAKPTPKKPAAIIKKPIAVVKKPLPAAVKATPSKKESAKPATLPQPPKPVSIKIPEIKTKQSEPVKQVTSVKSTPPASKDGARYNDKDLKEFETLIIEKLKQSRTDLEELRQSLSHTGDNSTDDTSPTFKIMEDGSDTMSREEIAQLASRQEKFITALENALLRIKNKTYGICRVTGKLIPKERLRLVPHATLSIEAKNMQA